MIYTITLNPSFDQTISCNNFQVNSLNRALDSRLDIGGKGINVSKIIACLQGQSEARGLLPEYGSLDFKSSLDSMGISHFFTIVLEEKIRKNYKIIDQTKNHFTEINETGPAVSLKYLSLMLDQLIQTVESEDIVVLSGSSPKNFPENTYQELIKKLKQSACKIFLDVDGQNLKYGIEAGPFFVKPNLFELEQLTGSSINSLNEIEQAAGVLTNKGIEHVLVSMGNQGSYYTNGKNKYYMQPLDVQVESPVGAGDSQVAAFAFGINNNLQLIEILKLTSAVSSAMVTTKGTIVPSFNKITELLKKVIVEKYI